MDTDTPVDNDEIGDSPEEELPAVEGHELNNLELPEFYDNLVDMLTPEEETKLATKYLDLIDRDKDANEPRQKLYADGIKRTGLSGDVIGGADFDGASKVVHPGLAEACIDFQARAIKELMPSGGPVKINIEGSEITEDKIKKAERKQRHMSWQLTKQIKEFRRVLEQVLAQTPLAGDAFIKFYPDIARGRPACEYIRGDKVLLPYAASDFFTAQRVTVIENLSEYEFERRIKSGMYRDVDLQIAVEQPDSNLVQIQMDKVDGKQQNNYNEDGTRTVYDIYAFEYFEKDDQSVGALAPYIITVDDSTRRVLAIYRNWEEGDKHQERMDWLIPFDFLVFDGARGLGFAHVAGSLSGSATGAMRALMDSAHIQNAPTGIILKGAKVGGQSKRIRMGNFTEIQSVPGIDDIRRIIQPIPFNPPSPVLFSMLGFIDAQMRGIVRTSMDSTADDNQNMPVGTKLSNIEQGLIVYSSIHQRLHASMNKVLEVLHRINRMYMSEFSEVPEDFATQEDYAGDIDVVPVSDPNIFSDVQRYQQLSIIKQLAMEAPQLYDMRAVHKKILLQAKVDYIDEIMPDEKLAEDENPAAENIKMAMGAQAIALPNQDHFAHLQVHLDFLTNPMYGGNKLFQARFLPLAVEHIKQHLLFLYGDLLREKIEQTIGVPFKEIKDKDEKVRRDISRVVAAASPIVMQEMQGFLMNVSPIIDQAMQLLQQLQPPIPVDPSVVAMKSAEMQAQTSMKAIEVQDKKADMDAQAKAQKLALEQKEMEQKRQETGIKIQADVLQNEQDNQTAKEIALMRLAQGASVGNMKDGSSFGRYEEGGLVTGPDETGYAGPIDNGISGPAGDDVTRGMKRGGLVKGHGEAPPLYDNYPGGDAGE